MRTTDDGVMRRNVQRGFTLLELLVSVAIIAILVAILVPSLDQAREAGRRAVCLSNLHQLSTAMAAYVNTFGAYPVWDLLSDDRSGEGWVAFQFGGKRASRQVLDWPDGNRLFYIVAKAKDRPLNPFVSAAPRAEPANITDDHQRAEIPVYRCPSDRGDFNLARGAPHSSIYDLTGTSYYMNHHWWAQSATLLPPRDRIPWGARLFMRRAARDASRFLLLEEETLFMSIAQGEEETGWHRRRATHNALMLDGHAQVLRATQEDLDRTPYPHAAQWTTYDERAVVLPPRR